MSDAEPVLDSTITCPHCGHRATETMPTDACQFFYDCKACGALLKPKPGDCCVFCSYGTLPCPPVQAGGGAPTCCAGNATRRRSSSRRAARAPKATSKVASRSSPRQRTSYPGENR